MKGDWLQIQLYYIKNTTVCLQWLVCSLRWQPAMMFTWCSLLLPFIAWLYKKAFEVFDNCLGTNMVGILHTKLNNIVSVVFYVNATCYSIVIHLFVLRIAFYTELFELWSKILIYIKYWNLVSKPPQKYLYIENVVIVYFNIHIFRV